MALSVSFNGATIKKPGSYSKTVIDLGGNFPISPVGVLGILGEADRGAPGSATIIQNNVFTAAQATLLTDTYGPASQIADACSLAFNPSNDAKITGGASAIYVYKTNGSTQAGVSIPTSYGLAQAQEYGIGGNLVSMAIGTATAEVLPAITDLFYLPSTGASGANDYKLNVNGLANQPFGVIAGYGAAAGGDDAFAAAAGALTGMSASGGVSTLLFAATDNTTVLTAANVSGVTTFTLSVAGTFTAVAQGSIFVLAGRSTSSWNGTYLCTTASTSSAISGIKLKDLATDAATLPVATAETFSAADTASRSFTPITLTVTAAQAQEQGATLQLLFADNNHVYGGTARTLLSQTAGNVATIKFGNVSDSFASVTVTLTGATWLSTPAAGDLVWILPDSQLAAGSNNTGAYYVTSATQSTVTLTKVNQGVGTYTAVSAVTVTPAGVNSDLRCFVGAQDTPNFASEIDSLSERTVVFTFDQTRDNIVETSSMTGGEVALQLGYANASATAATATVNQQTSRLTTAITGVSNVALNVNLLQYPTLQSLVNYLNAQPGYAAAVAPAFANLSPTALDAVTSLGILSLSLSPVATPGHIKKDVFDVEQVFAESSLVTATVTATVGLPTAMSTTFLAGGIVGSTQAASILAALDEFEKVRINTVVPLFSRDAPKDIAEGFTDPSSSYMIDSVHAAVKSHVILMSNTKNRSERHAALAARDTYANVKTKAATLSTFRAQLMFQDIKALSTDGNLKWMQPHMLASMVGGLRAGATLGLPLTFKFFNVSGIRQTNSPLLSLPQNVVIDFDPAVDYDDAIGASLTFLEAPTSGGFRMVVDNTTYSIDDNWVYNRMETLHTADSIAFDFRTRLENTLVGSRNTDFTQASITALCATLLEGYRKQGLLGNTSDAPNGYSGLSVQVNGNTVTINATLILVEGIDFVLSTLTLKRNTAAA